MAFVVLMGGPGAGKGTQARRLQETLGLPQIATGDLFREHLKNNSELGLLAKKYMDAGDLVPDTVTVAMVRERVAKPDCANGALLDGFPRTIAQAEALDELLSELGEHIGIVPYIHVDPEVLLKRLAGRWTCQAKGHVFHAMFNPPKEAGVCDYDGSTLYQREDDTERTQRRRIEVYFEQTEPLLEYYRKKKLLVKINGDQSIDKVHEELVAAIRGAELSSL
jgi:adenylate kinase